MAASGDGGLTYDAAQKDEILRLACISAVTHCYWYLSQTPSGPNMPKAPTLDTISIVEGPVQHLLVGASLSR